MARCFRVLLLLILSTVTVRGGGFEAERCHSPPQSDGAHRAIAITSGDFGSDVFPDEAVRVMVENSRRHFNGDGLNKQLFESDRGEFSFSRNSIHSPNPALNYSFFPQVVYTPSGCRDTDNALCAHCCNGACCEKVSDVPGDSAYNPPEVLNKTGGFNDISTTARLIVPVRIVLIAREGATHRFSVAEINDQLSVVNRYFATSKFRFVAHSFDRVESNAMSDSCQTDPCYSNPSTCSFFQNTLPKFVHGDTSAVDVMNVFVCTQIKYLGEAQFPWTSVEASPTHYVQIQYGAWLAKTPASLYGLGMTMVHEIGHYFGALHTFEKEGVCDTDGDYVDDTVPCKTYASITDPCDTRRDSCGKGFDDLANIMNYAADRCMQYFSRGQLLRMEQATLRYRQEFMRRHFVEADCPIGGANNNLDSCTCTDGGSIATLCGVYAERLPITLFLPGSQRYNGQLYNPPDAPLPPLAQDPMMSPGLLVLFALAVMASVSAVISLLALLFCCVAGDSAMRRAPPQKEVLPWAVLGLVAATAARGEQEPSRRSNKYLKNRAMRDDTFSLHISSQENASQAPAPRVRNTVAPEDDEYSDASAGDVGAQFSVGGKPYIQAEEGAWALEEDEEGGFEEGGEGAYGDEEWPEDAAEGAYAEEWPEEAADDAPPEFDPDDEWGEGGGEEEHHAWEEAEEDVYGDADGEDAPFEEQPEEEDAEAHADEDVQCEEDYVGEDAHDEEHEDEGQPEEEEYDHAPPSKSDEAAEGEDDDDLR